MNSLEHPLLECSSSELRMSLVPLSPAVVADDFGVSPHAWPLILAHSGIGAGRGNHFPGLVELDLWRWQLRVGFQFWNWISLALIVLLHFLFHDFFDCILDQSFDVLAGGRRHDQLTLN